MSRNTGKDQFGLILTIEEEEILVEVRFIRNRIVGFETYFIRGEK
jgi:hypothetical protein